MDETSHKLFSDATWPSNQDFGFATRCVLNFFPQELHRWTRAHKR
jgi:hypothetical protein